MWRLASNSLDREPRAGHRGRTRATAQWRGSVGKMIDCGKVNPTSGCGHVIRADTEEEAPRLAGEHAREHGLEATPELVAQVRAHVEEA
jgi:predicted small metal-binding protein